MGGIGIVALVFVGLGFTDVRGSCWLAEWVGESSVPVQHQRVLSFATDEVAGFEYFRRENCRQCHNLLDGEPKRGPNLAGLEDRRRSPDWMESHFRKPSDETAAMRENRRPMSAPQMNALITWASNLTPEKARDLNEAPAAILAGADIYVSNRCGSCHKVNGAGGNLGPSLNGLAARRSRQWIEKHFKAPKTVSAGSIMPPYHFSANQQDLIIAYLLQLP